MKIAVVCANGKAGRCIVKEALDRGLEVTAIVRGDSQSAAKEVVKKDLYELTAADLKGFDVVCRRLRRLDGGDSAAAQHIFKASVRHPFRHTDPAAGGRRRRKPLCQQGAYRLCRRWAGLSGRLQAPCCCNGQGAGTAA